ncbi:hypothetical protein DPMN_165479 [Dreissena polymorpha]|uniref:Uncharacterized protein n=1 Tax=Dreissena polymorpha TaxID=45954 RepID=A0A9D4IUM4_DREPO|nr:hypothetical protein DPMN_165479 [Dreissena polymorpha]
MQYILQIQHTSIFNGGRSISNLRFADVIAQMGETSNKIQNLTSADITTAGSWKKLLASYNLEQFRGWCQYQCQYRQSPNYNHHGDHGNSQIEQIVYKKLHQLPEQVSCSLHPTVRLRYLNALR